ncbi:MAG: hypothetical protein CM15mP14_4130 [Rhodospirillaceae bacterium]|nr:MAG: hypothetical protein CM15mP14_4130 [Rhodospirillaceae bacterium]
MLYVLHQKKLDYSILYFNELGFLFDYGAGGETPELPLPGEKPDFASQTTGARPLLQKSKQGVFVVGTFSSPYL